MKQHALARNLAFFSLGLGMAELLAPRKIARLIGIGEDHDRLLQAMGLREISAGLGIMQGRTDYFLWSRVAGDALDLALLAAAYRSENNDRRRVTIAMAAVAGVTVLDVVASILHSRDLSEPEWRDPRPMESRSGIARQEPAALRAATEVTMTQFAPGNSANGEGELTEAGSPLPTTSEEINARN